MNPKWGSKELEPGKCRRLKHNYQEEGWRHKYKGRDCLASSTPCAWNQATQNHLWFLSSGISRVVHMLGLMFREPYSFPSILVGNLEQFSSVQVPDSNCTVCAEPCDSELWGVSLTQHCSPPPYLSSFVWVQKQHKGKNLFHLYLLSQFFKYHLEHGEKQSLSGWMLNDNSKTIVF